MTDNLRGILAVLLGSTAFVMNDALVKLVSAEVPASQINVARGVVATLMLVVICFLMRALRPISVLLTPMMLLRLGAAAAATTFIVIGLRHLPLPVMTTALQVTPLAVTAGSAIVFGEQVGWRRWLAALAGFMGVVLIVKPGGILHGAAYLALIALFWTTVRDLTTRGLDRTIPSLFVAAGSAAAIGVAGAVLVPFDSPWVVPSARAWGLLGAAATCMVVANIFIIISLRTGEIAVVAPFRYVPVPLSIWLGWWWWGDMLDGLAFAGVAMIMGAGLYMLHRERASLRSLRRPALDRSPAE